MGIIVTMDTSRARGQQVWSPTATQAAEHLGTTARKTLGGHRRFDLEDVRRLAQSRQKGK